MTKEALLTEIADMEALIADTSVPAEEKDFARSELAQYNAQLAVLEGAETTEPVVVTETIDTAPESAKKGKGRPAGSKNKKAKVEKKGGKEKKAEEMFNKLGKKFAKIKKPKEVEKIYDKQEDENEHTANAVLLATVYGTDSDIETAKRLFISQIVNDDLFDIKERDAMLTGALWDKHKVALAGGTKKSSPTASNESAYSEIAELKELIDSGALPAEEKAFAEEQISALYSKLNAEEMATSVPVTPKHRKAGIKHAPKAPKKVYTGKTRGRKVGYRKPRPDDGATEKTEKGIYPAIKVNSLLTRHVGHVWRKAGIRFAVGDTVGKFTIYVITPSSKINRAYELYSELANKHDVRVSKADAMTKY